MKFYCDSCSKTFTADIADDCKEVVCPACGKNFPISEDKVGPGVILGDFRIKSIISKGGMGVVFLANQISLDRDVALKVLQNKHVEDKEYVESLYREARAAAKINHPNVVQAYAIGEEDGIFYFAMEYVRGDTFKNILKEKGGKLEFKEAAKVVRDVARALSAAWREQKLVHQDIKPDNIMLDANGFAKLADLGLARTASTVQEETDDSDEVLGTPQYISPEQLTGVPTDVRSDIYSLGATFYQFVTGRYAYVADSLDDLPRLHVEGNLEPPKSVNPDLPDAVNNIIIKMMARKPENRYQNPDDLVADLDKFIADSGKPAAPKIGGGAAVPKFKLSAGKAGSGNAAAAKTEAKPAPAKAPLSLNLNGVKPAVPAAKPAAPAAAKPAIPQAKPAAPAPAAAASSPDVPKAKPVAPAVPAAKPAAPAATPKEAVPVKPAPQTPPADKKEKNKKKTEKTAGETAEKLMNLFGKSFKLTVLIATALIVISIGFVVTVMILDSKGKLPGFLAPVGNYLGNKADAAKAKAIELAKPQDVAVEDPTPKGPVTRPEFIKSLEDVINFRMLNPQDGKKFLEMADAVYPTLPSAATEDEVLAVERFLKVYSPVDEKLRCASGREKLRSVYVKKLDLAAENRAKAEAERLAQIEAQKRKAAEAAELAAKIDAQNKLAQQQQAKKLEQMKKDCLIQGEKLAEAMLRAVIEEDNSAMETALLDVDDFIRLAVVQTAEEKKIFSQLTKFIAAVKKEMNVLKLYKRRLGNINKNHNLDITLFDKSVALVENVSPEGISCRNERDVLRQVKFYSLPDSSRARFAKTVAIRFKKQLPNPGFFIALFERHVDKLALKDRPEKGFWKDYWSYFEKSLKK